MARASQRPTTLRIPARGFDDARFDRLGDDHRVHVAMLWHEPLSQQACDAVGQVLSAWLADQVLWARARSPRVAWVYQTRLTSAGLVFTLVNACNARAPLGALQQRLGALGVEPRELLVGLHRLIDGVGETTVFPAGTRVAPAASGIQDYWDQCFDLRAPAPDSERDDECWATPAELRFGRLEVPGLRLCYRTPTALCLDGDARAGAVGSALRRALRERFTGLAHPWPRDGQRRAAAIPVPRDRSGRPARRLERIYRLGRAGYRFSIDATELCVELLREDQRGTAYRYREHELFQAVQATIAALGLEPVAMWRRFPTRGWLEHIEVQLWEQPRSATSRAVRARVDARRRALARSGRLAVLPVHEAPPAAPAFEPARKLGKGAVLLRGPGPLALALRPDAHGKDTLWVVGAGAPRAVKAPASRYYRDLDRVAYSQDGRRCLLATPSVLRMVDLAVAGARDIVTGFGYLQVVALEGTRALVRGALGGEHELDGDDADTVRVARKQGHRAGPGSRAEVEPALYLLDTKDGLAADDILLAIIPCRADDLAALDGGRVVAVWTSHEQSWRSALLAVRGRELGLITTMDEALPHLRDVAGRALSPDGIELVNHGRAARGKLRSLDEIAP